MELETLRGAHQGYSPSTPKQPLLATSNGGSPRTPKLQPIKIESPTAAFPASQQTGSPSSARWARLRNLESPVQDFGRLQVELSTEHADDDKWSAKASTLSPQLMRKPNADDAEDSVRSSTVTDDSEADHGGRDEDNASNSYFYRLLSPANVEADRHTMEVHDEYLGDHNFHRIHSHWINGGNLRGNLVDSISYQTLREMMVGFICNRPSLLYLHEFAPPRPGTAGNVSGSGAGGAGASQGGGAATAAEEREHIILQRQLRAAAAESAEKVAKVLLLLLKDVDVQCLHLSEASTVTEVVAKIWRGGKTELSSRPLVLIVSTQTKLRQNLEYALLDLVKNKQMTDADETHFVKGRFWLVFVSLYLDVGFSHWVRRECLTSSHLSFGKPVGGLNPEIDPLWLSRHEAILRSVYQDDDFARWTRDLVSLLRISPYVQPNLVVGLADAVQMCAKAFALVYGRAWVCPSDYTYCLKSALRHHIMARPGSPHPSAEVIEMCVSLLTFPV